MWLHALQAIGCRPKFLEGIPKTILSMTNEHHALLTHYLCNKMNAMLANVLTSGIADQAFGRSEEI